MSEEIALPVGPNQHFLLTARGGEGTRDSMSKELALLMGQNQHFLLTARGGEGTRGQHVERNCVFHEPESAFSIDS